MPRTCLLGLGSTAPETQNYTSFEEDVIPEFIYGSADKENKASCEGAGQYLGTPSLTL